MHTELSEWAQVVLARIGTASSPAVVQSLIDLLADLAGTPSASDPSQAKLDRAVSLLAADTDEAVELAADLLASVPCVQYMGHSSDADTEASHILTQYKSNIALGTTKEAQRIESIYGTLSVPYVDAIGYASKGTDGTKSADVDVVGTEQTVDAAHDQEMVADGEDESSIGVPCVQYMGHSEQQATFAPLSRADLVLATFQIWHNTPHVPPTAEWALRIDADNSEKRNGGPWVLVHHVLFKRSPRKHRYVMARYVREGKVSAEWAAKHVEQTRKLPPNTWIGLMTKQQFKDKTPPGKSGNAHWVYQGCWATLTLDAAGTKPECLTVYFGDEPVEVRQFAPSTSGDDKAPEWLGEYDPNGIRKSVTQMDRIRQNALKDRTLATHMPTNKVVARFRDQEIRLRELEAENAAMQARIDALETEKAR